MRTSDKKPKSEARRAAQTSPPPPLHLSPTAWAWAKTWRPGEIGILSPYPTPHLTPSSTSITTILISRSHLSPSSAQGVWSTAKGWLLRSETSPACWPPVAAPGPLSQTIYKTSSPTVLQTPPLTHRVWLPVTTPETYLSLPQATGVACLAYGV